MQIPELQRHYNFDRLALDFNHNSFPKSDAYKGEPVTVAAYGELKIFSGDGAYLENLQWTPEGCKAWGNKDYIDVSPVVKTNKHGEVIFFHSAALCRNGKLEGLHAFSSDISEIIFTQKNQNSKKEIMNVEEMKKLIAAFCAFLGISPDSDYATITEAANAEGEKKNKAKPEGNEKPTKLEKPSEAVSEQNKDLEAFSSQLNEISRRINTLEVEGLENKKRSIVDAAVALGKRVPAGVESKFDVVGLETFCANLPAGVVPLDRRTSEGLKEFSSNPVASGLSADVCKTLGISAETFKKGAV